VSPSRRSLLGASLSLLSLLLLGFVLDVAVLGDVRHARAQRVAYADLRTDLAAATAPTGQLDVDGRPVALGRPVATLTAPDLGLVREVVFEGTTSGVLAKGPGHVRTTVLPGQPGTAVLLGRAWSHGGPFGGADRLDPGSVLTVTTGQGTHTFRVSGTRRAGDVVPALAPGRGRLTLVTATGAAYVPEGVVYVDADLTSPVVPAPPRALGPASLAAAELPLEGEATSWPVIVLLLQGLALSTIGLAWATRRFGRGPAWLAGVPVAVLLLLLSSREATRLLPNLL
jgi:hypothetical protein